MEYKLESKVWYHPPAEADSLVTDSISDLLFAITAMTDDDTIVGSHHLMGEAIKYCSTATRCAKGTLRVEIMPHDEEARKRCNEFFIKDVVDAFDTLKQEIADSFSIELAISPRPPALRTPARSNSLLMIASFGMMCTKESLWWTRWCGMP